MTRARDATNDDILIVDLESTCWDFGSEPPNETSDILEIGVCHLKLDDLTISNNWSVITIPTRSKITEFCTQLNGITEDDVKARGVPLEAGFDNLVMSKSRQRTWASYGNYDRRKMEEDARDLKLKYPMSPRHINVKTLLATLFGLPKEIGMAQALELLKMPLVGRYHSGRDDAKNIAKILAWIYSNFRQQLTRHIWPDGTSTYAV